MLLLPLRRLNFYLLWGTLAVYALAPAADMVTPTVLLGRGLLLVALASGGVAWLLFLVALLLRGRVPGVKRDVVLFLTLGLMVVLASLWSFSLARSRDALVARSEERLDVVRMGTLSVEDLREVTAEVEGALEGLAQEWGVSLEGVRLTLLVHPDADALRRYTGLPDWAGGATRCYGGGPRVHLVAGPAPNARGLTLSAPAHEAVHALMCAVWGVQAFTALPLWFHEGVATEFSARGLVHLPQRVLVRLQLWLSRETIPPGQTFCTRAYLTSRDDAWLFYASSLEFVRYLRKRYGADIVPRVMDRVHRGASFGDALESLTGSDCGALFEAWRTSF